MSFLSGYLAVANNEDGDSGVVRIGTSARAELKYAIDSIQVEDLEIFQNDAVLPSHTEILGDKTIVSFSVSPDKWFGIVYLRRGFLHEANGVFGYSDYWSLPPETAFFLLLPRFSVLTALNIDELQCNQFNLDGRPLMSQYFGGGNLRIEADFVIDSQSYWEQGLRTLTPSAFPHVNSKVVLGMFRDQASSTQSALHRIAGRLDWLSRGLALHNALKIIGLL